MPLLAALGLTVCVGCGGNGNACGHPTRRRRAGKRVSHAHVPPVRFRRISPTRRASTSPITTARSAKNCCRKRWAPASPFHRLRQRRQAGLLSSTPVTGRVTRKARPVRRPCALPQRGRRQVRGRDRSEAALGRRDHVRHGRDRRRLRQRRLPGRFRHRRRRQSPVPQRARQPGSAARFEDVTAEAGVGGPGGWPSGGRRFPESASSRSTGRRRPPSSTTTATAGSTCSCATTSPGRRITTWLSRLHAHRQGPGLWPAQRRSRARTASSITTWAAANSRTCPRRPGISVQQAPTRRRRLVGKSLAVIVCDVDDDGWPDIVVANDTVAKLLFHNRAGDGTLRGDGADKWASAMRKARPAEPWGDWAIVLRRQD